MRSQKLEGEELSWAPSAICLGFDAWGATLAGSLVPSKHAVALGTKGGHFSRMWSQPEPPQYAPASAQAISHSLIVAYAWLEQPYEDSRMPCELLSFPMARDVGV